MKGIFNYVDCIAAKQNVNEKLKTFFELQERKEAKKRNCFLFRN